MSDAARRALVTLSAVLPGRSPRELRTALREAARRCSPEAVEECLLQSYLFLGFPAALTALAAWRDIRPAELATSRGEEAVAHGWRNRGEDVCRTVYGRAYDKLRSNVRRVHPDMDRWMIEEGYGKVLGRPGLELATRELCVVALLAAAVWEPQLHSHLRGALHAGNPAAHVQEALEAGLARQRDDTWSERARELWRRVRSGWTGG